MYDVRSTLPLHVPDSIKKSFTKWVSAQRAIIVQKTSFTTVMTKGPGYGLAEQRFAISSIAAGVNLYDDIYLLIQPIYDPEKEEISFFEDADGIPVGYHLAVESINGKWESSDQKVTSITCLFIIILEKDEDTVKSTSTKEVTEKPKKETKPKKSAKTTSTKKKATAKKKV